MRAGILSTVPALQADAVLALAPPTGAPTVLLQPKPNCRLIACMASVTWTVQPTPLRMIVSIDGQTITAEVANPVSTTVYYLNPDLGDLTAHAWLLSGSVENAVRQAFVLEGRSLGVTMQIVGGTVQNLDARAIYALY